MVLARWHCLICTRICVRLTPTEVLHIRQVGPFTRDPKRVKFVLDPDVVRDNVDKWMVESMGFVKQAMLRSGVSDPRNLTVAKIARSQCGRPQVSPGGRTHYDLLPPLLDTDTKSHADGIEIIEHCFRHCKSGDPGAEQLAQMFPHLPQGSKDRLSDVVAGKMDVCAILARGDGQGLITIARERKLNLHTSDMFPKVVPCNGGFHSCGHFAFAVNEGYHDSKYGRTKVLLSKEKVPKHIPNFENDSYLHTTTHIREDLIGTLSYFLLDVQRPIPELLLDDPVAYLGQIKKAGGVAAFQSMRLSGNPSSHYIRAARAADGKCHC